MPITYTNRKGEVIDLNAEKILFLEDVIKQLEFDNSIDYVVILQNVKARAYEIYYHNREQILFDNKQAYKIYVITKAQAEELIYNNFRSIRL